MEAMLEVLLIDYNDDLTSNKVFKVELDSNSQNLFFFSVPKSRQLLPSL